MISSRRTLLLASGALLLALGEASAQVPGPLAPGRPPAQSGPTFSPYLNLLRRDNNAALNYYGLVRPELQWRSSVRQLSQDIQEAQTEITAAQAGVPGLQTGHPVQFMNLSHFYGSAGGQAAAGRVSVAPTYPSGSASQGGAPAKAPARGR